MTERRRVAEWLREVASTAGPDGTVPLSDVVDACGLDPGGYNDFTSPESVERLADLIDPPPSVVERFNSGSYFLSCGHVCRSLVLPLYCPRCGARVVKPGEDKQPRIPGLRKVVKGLGPSQVSTKGGE